MKALAKGLMTIALVAATAACDGSPTTASAFVPENDGVQMAKSSTSLTFSSTQSYDTETPQTASGSVGGIDFTGSMWTGTPCYNVSATHGTGPGSITVTVSARSQGGACSQIITYNNYTGRVSGLAAGSYTFTVVHDYGSSTTTAYAGVVTVQ